MKEYHRISQVNTEEMTGLCSVCGPVRVVKTNATKYRCHLKAQRDRNCRNKGITMKQYDEAMARQNNCCAGCDRHISEFKKSFAIDHDHNCCPGIKACGKCFRGLLCTGCNRLLGLVNDNSSQLRKLADYLER